MEYRHVQTGGLRWPDSAFTMTRLVTTAAIRVRRGLRRATRRGGPGNRAAFRALLRGSADAEAALTSSLEGAGRRCKTGSLRAGAGHAQEEGRARLAAGSGGIRQ